MTDWAKRDIGRFMIIRKRTIIVIGKFFIQLKFLKYPIFMVRFNQS